MVQLYTHTASAVKGKTYTEAPWGAIYSRISCVVSIINGKKNNFFSSMELDDIVQDACIKVFTGLSSFDKSKGTKKAWFNSIISNAFYDAMRERKKYNSLFSEVTSKTIIKDDEEYDSFIDSLDRCVSQEEFDADFEGLLDLVLSPLCESYQKTIRCIVDEVPAEEMPEIIGCSKKNLRPTICRAKAKVHESLKTYGIL